MTKEPPVTPQELREIAAITESLCGANLHDLRPAKSPCKDCIARANRLHSQADWLELHMPLYREAVESDELTRLRAEVESLEQENESLRKQIAKQPSRPDSLKPMDAWLDMDSFSEPWACDLVCYAQKLERHVAYLRGLLERARDHMNGDGFAFDLKQEIDRAMEKAE